MDISNLTDRQITDNIRRYRERNVTVGGPFALAELLSEQASRTTTPFGVTDTVNAIVETARQSSDGLTTYKDIWQSFTSEPWVGHNSLTQVGNALGRVIHYCRENDMPILTTLVVRGDKTRQHAPKAKENIFETAREVGYQTGNDIDVFVTDQQNKAKAFIGTRAVPDLP